MLNIAAVGLYMLLTSISNNPDAITPPTVADNSSNVVMVERKEESENEVDVDVESRVREYFSDTPILAEVARCESHFRQFGTNGKIIRGKQNPNDVGVMQINEKYHLKRSRDLNMDIYTLEGNLAYGRELYKEYGARPWLASSVCWSKSKELAMK